MLRNIASKESKSALSVVDGVSVQPNAVDMRIDRVFKFAPSEMNFFKIDEDDKVHAEKIEIFPNKDGYWVLPVGCYEIQFAGIVKIAEDQAGWVITRSTLNRNGVFLTSGLYDSKYEGAAAGALHVTAVTSMIKKGTRVGQFILCDAEMLFGYDGSYGFNPDGTPKVDEAIYHKGK